MTRTDKRRLRCLAFAAITILAGLVWRLAPLSLPLFLYKYGGSVLWAAMVYWLVAAVLPRRNAVTVAIASALIAIAVELFKLHHSPSLDAFRLTLAGKLLLGRIFSLADIAAYCLAIAVTAAADYIMRARPCVTR